MSKEEKEAVEYIKAFQKDLYGASEKNLMAIYIDRVWNYIDKLQKENKELKEELLHWKGIYHLLSRKVNYISKDKIREKIKELEGQEDWYIENKNLDELYGIIDILKELLEGE